MAYIPSTLTIASWTVPISIVGTDAITSLDNSVNAIIDTDANSAKAYLNTELAKIPTYLSGEMTSIYNDLAGQVNVIAGLTSSADELNILDGATVTTTELNILDGVTSSTAEINVLDGLTAGTSDLNKTSALTSGTYTPTFTAGTGTNASTFTGVCQYSRVGNIVIVGFSCIANPTSSGTSVTFKISLPIASSVSSQYEINGTASLNYGGTLTSGYVYGDTAGNGAYVRFTSMAVASHACTGTFIYEIK